MQNIIIIGAGFSGTLTAVQLIRNSSGQPINVTLVDRNCDMGRGVAYKSDSKNYFLNVPAGNMSALEEDPNHFIEYCKKYNKKIVPSSFVSRAIYGDYLEQLLSDNERSLDGQVVITRVFGEVISLSAGNGTTPPSVTFKDGKKLTGNSIVLATGNYPPQNIRIFDRTFYLNEKYANDPWQLKTTTIFDRTVPTLLIGSGLTAIDICTSLLHKPGNEKIYLVSRHGLLPQSHRVSLPTYKTDQFTKPIPDGLKTLRAQLRATRRQIHIASSGGADWREIINSIRPHSQKIWKYLQVKDKLRFLRHLRPYWEVYRHRLAPEPHENFQRALEEGKVEIIAGRIIDFMQIDTENIKAIIRFRHSNENVQLRIGQVINCTGPSSNLTQIDDELIKNLLKKNIILPDPLGLGLQVSDQLAVMDRFGNPSNNIFYIGPLLRAKYWEATAVPELRVFARQLAIHILNPGLGSATKT